MTTTHPRPSDPESSARLKRALGEVLRRYGAQIRRRPRFAVPALLLPGLGDILIFYGPPLVVAKLLAAFARGDHFTATELAPYVLAAAGCWLLGEILWRAAGFAIARTEIRAIEA